MACRSFVRRFTIALRFALVPRYMRAGEPRYEDAIVCENVTIRTPDNLPLIRALSFAVQRGESMLVMGTFQRVFCFF